MLKILRQILKHIEFVAYMLAVWSFLVLFFEPVIGYYMNFGRVEFYTAVANLLLLLLTIGNRLLFGEERGTQKIIIFDILMLAMGMLLLIYQAKFVIFVLLVRQTYFIIQFLLFRFSEGKVFRWLSSNPPVAVMLSFATVIFLGTVLLMLPVASNFNRVTPLVEALFTATSATCVTGLVVLDTGVHFSLFGQLVILLLIQIGGLGIMTLSTFFALILGQNINLKLKNVMNQVVGGAKSVNVFQLLKNIVAVTLVIEVLGALILFIKFSQDLSLLRAIYLSFFHSISAFCNAGFSPLSDNLVSYADSAVVSLTIPMLIFLGGIGFTVLIDLNHFIFFREKVRKLSLHTKIVLATTAILLALGFATFLLFEYHGSMQDFPVQKRILSSIFQSATTRTAGFNTIDISTLSKATVLISLVLMFIGASPGSTGGGIKTTTFSLLALTVISMIKGRRDLSVFKRRIPLANFREATGLTMLSAVIVGSIVLILLVVESHPFEKVLFEAVSAFGTVGLSMGITADLTVLGKLLITLLMYIGRIGPLTMVYAFAIRNTRSNINYAEETIAIG